MYGLPLREPVLGDRTKGREVFIPGRAKTGELIPLPRRAARDPYMANGVLWVDLLDKDGAGRPHEAARMRFFPLPELVERAPDVLPV